MSEHAMPTMGPVHVLYLRTGQHGHEVRVAPNGRIVARLPRSGEWREADADLIAAAFNAATEARAMGFDPIGAVQALRSLLALLTTTVDETTCFCDDRTACGGTKPCWQCRVRETLAAARTREETP